MFKLPIHGAQMTNQQWAEANQLFRSYSTCITEFKRMTFSDSLFDPSTTPRTSANTPTLNRNRDVILISSSQHCPARGNTFGAPCPTTPITTNNRPKRKRAQLGELNINSLNEGYTIEGATKKICITPRGTEQSPNACSTGNHGRIPGPKTAEPSKTKT